MTTIYKYPLKLQSENEVSAPFVKILGVYPDAKGEHCLYALVNTDRPLRKYAVSMYGTGWDLEGKLSGKDYHGTIRLNDVLVLHVFGKEIE